MKGKGRTGMQWNELVTRVREYGRYATDAETKQVIRVVLSALGGHLTNGVRERVAGRLPATAAETLRYQLPATKPLTAAEFVETVARRLDGATSATARWDVSSVLAVLAEVCGDDLTDQVLADLPEGYALLFGRGQLLHAA
ncbi:hypothetical protein DB35_23600 [Streptomyces abyssalis]|uniref:DUF2267 domain-containing protein n=2 Tax=Streptomyces abyssalis TaxID=933944 RepID=A0A1E7JNU2_9ACTN|nr:hypothetical protein DB35_23600 [Streptomyces abyssalis]OEU89951.1 hypothetical protein AN215_09930 [Streptomyces abyssalis]OEV30240.1 hypothetical protein AN219_12035 [Streptomyces nanshensis]